MVFFPLKLGGVSPSFCGAAGFPLPSHTHTLVLFALAVIQLLCNVKHRSSFGGPIACPLSPIVTGSKLAKFI